METHVVVVFTVWNVIGVFKLPKSCLLTNAGSWALNPCGAARTACPRARPSNGARSKESRDRRMAAEWLVVVEDGEKRKLENGRPAPGEHVAQNGVNEMKVGKETSGEALWAMASNGLC